MPARKNRRPSLVSPCVADRYARPGERIAEFSFAGVGHTAGGLIALAVRHGRPTVELYRVDPDVAILAPVHPAPATTPGTVRLYLLYTYGAGVAGISVHLSEADRDAVLIAFAQDLGYDGPDDDADAAGEWIDEPNRYDVDTFDLDLSSATAAARC